jgi:4-hydroxy-4-methyl-2-oxoglutarate aldolase
MTEKKLTGKIPREAIGLLSVPRPPAGLIEGFKKLGDATSTISDAMDEMGLQGVISGSVLKPTMLDKVIVGPALTMRNIVQMDSPYKGAKDRISKMAEIEAHNLAQPGDVLVIEGVDGLSNMGGISATIGQRQGEIGAIVDGGVRDVGEQRRIGYPIWSRSVSPVTGKWRVQTVAVNVKVEIAGVAVNPGDIVVADETGVCIIPLDKAAAVLERAVQIFEAEGRRYDDVRGGLSVPELAQKTHVYKFGS